MLTSSIFIAALCSNVSHAQFTEGEKCREAKIYIHGSKSVFSGRTFILFGETMVPIAEFLSKIGVHVTWNSYTNQLIVYDNNIYLKLMQNNFLTYVNGFPNTMRLPAVLYRGELYAPASFLLKALEIDFSQSGDILDINYFESKGDTIQQMYTTYKRYALLDEGISLFIPIEYSYNDKVFFSEIDGSSISAIKKSEWDFKGETTENSINGYIKYSQSTDGEAYNYYVSPVSDYVIALHKVNPIYEEKIMESVDIDNKLPNTKLEHYYEFSAFHNLGIKLNGNVYSNMIIDGSADFSGTAEADGKLKIRVSMGSEKHEYYIGIVDGEFKGRIFLPFGTGKHNISVHFVDSEEIAHEALIFSAISVSESDIIDIMPTTHMDYNSAIARETLAKIGSRGINQKTTAETIYRWILKNYEFDAESSSIRKLSEMLASTEKISAQETCIMYAGLLRSVGIPAKIAMKRGSRHYWVEAYLNGDWKSMGIVSDIKNNTFFYFYKDSSDSDAEYLDF